MKQLLLFEGSCLKYLLFETACLMTVGACLNEFV